MTSSSTLSPPPVASAPDFGTAPAAKPPLLAGELRGMFDGREWVYRSGGDAVLREIAPYTWEHPETAGWTRVKQNDRREVWRAVIRDVPYYLKYYFANPWRAALTGLFRLSPCQAEWSGGLFAARAGIPAVRPVAYTMNLRRGSQRCALLVTEALEPAQPLNEFWQLLLSDADPVRRRADIAQIIERLAQMIARAHQSGFEHLDMHVANILVQPTAPRRYRTVFVDLHSARRGVPISDRAVVRNLAQLNQWFRKRSTIGDRLRFLRAYLRWRNEYEHAFQYGRPLGLTFEQLVAALVSAAHRHTQRLGTKRDHRVLRDGRYFTTLKLPGGWRGMAIACCKQPTDESRASHLRFDQAWWEAQVRDPLAWFQTAGAAVRKDSHSSMVCQSTLAHEAESLPVIIKRPRSRNGWRRFVQLWPPSRSMRGWRIGHMLLHRDLPTARPLAVLERRVGPFVLDSLLLTEVIPGAVDLEAYLLRCQAALTPRAWVRFKHELTPLLAVHVRRLAERGFEHRDCKATNILVVPHQGRKLLWIDMDGLRFVGSQTLVRRLRPLVRLHVSLLGIPGLTRTDRVRFLKTYLMRFGTSPNAWRAVWPALEAAAAEKQRAVERHRAWKRAHYGRE